MLQPDDHERTGHGAAGLAGSCHPRTKCARDAKRCLAVQTGPLPVGGQDCLGSGETVEEQGKCLINIIVLAHLIIHSFTWGTAYTTTYRSRAGKLGAQRRSFKLIALRTGVARSKKAALVRKNQMTKRIPAPAVQEHHHPMEALMDETCLFIAPCAV
jgi:hypothetical protein